jgi:hypothetical protein
MPAPGRPVATAAAPLDLDVWAAEDAAVLEAAEDLDALVRKAYVLAWSDL